MKMRLFTTLLFAMFSCVMLCASPVQHERLANAPAQSSQLEDDSVSSYVVTFTVSDFEGQGVSGGATDGSSSVTASRDGVTVSCSNAYGTSSELRCYRGAELTIVSDMFIQSISFSMSSQYSSGLNSSYEVNASSWTASPSAQVRIKSIELTLSNVPIVVNDSIPSDTIAPTPVDTAVLGLDGNYVILAQRADTSHWFYMTSDLGTGTIKRYQAVDAGTAVLAEVNTANLDSKYYWQVIGNKLHTQAGYSTWKSGNSGNLDDVGTELTFQKNDDGTYWIFFDNGNEVRYLSMNANYGSNYFAYYKQTQIYSLTLLKAGDSIQPTDTIVPTPIDTTTPMPQDTIEPTPVDTTHYMTLAELMTLTANTSGLTFGAFDVVYVNGNYTYIKDETGAALIYKSNYGLNAGDHVEAGLQGSLSIYNKLYEIVPTSTVAELTVTAGQSPAIPDATEVSSFNTMNQVVVYRGIHFSSSVNMSSSNRTVQALWGENDQAVTLYNRNNVSYSFVANKLYNILGVNSVYNTTYQVDVHQIAEDTVTDNPADTIQPVEITYVTASCAGLMTLPDSTYVELGAFDVVYVTGAYIYIKDDTGAGLVFMRNYGLKAGDYVAAGLRGQMVLYRGRYEVIPMTPYAELTVTDGGTPVYEEATELPNFQNMNAVRIYRHVYFPEDATMDSKNLTVTAKWGGPEGETITLYNRESLNFFFGAGRMYTITGGNSVFNGAYQVEVFAADEEINEQNPVDTAFIYSTCSALMSMLDPTMADSFAMSYLSPNDVNLFVYFEEPVCNEMVMAGSYNGWSTDANDLVHMTALPGCEGWYAAVIPYSDSVLAKPVQLLEDGAFSWAYQTGDADSWLYVAGQPADIYNTGYAGESEMRFLSPGVYVYRSLYFKGHNSPCNVLRHNYTVTLAAPPCYYEPAIIGDFSLWLESYPMTKNNDGTYSYTWSDFEGNAFKFRAATSQEWENEIWIFNDSLNGYVANPNIILGSDTLIYLDYSNGTYSLGCPPPDTTYIPVTCKQLMTLQDDGNTFVELGAFDVVYVNNRHTYIRDTTGAGLIYHSDSLALKVGDHVEAGFRGKFAIYAGLYEIYPISSVTELTVTAGEAPEIAEATTLPSFDNMNEVLVYKGVRFGQSYPLTTSTSTAYGLWGDDYGKLEIFNKFGIRYTFENNKSYDITVANSVYNGRYQVYFISAEEFYEEPVVTIFGKEVSITDPEDSTVVLEQVDVFGDSTLMYNVGENTLTFTGANMTVGDSVSTAISYTGTEPLTIVICDSSTIFADTIISSDADVYITGEGMIEMEAVVPIIGTSTSIITFDSVNLYVHSLPTPASVRRRIRGGKRLDETGGPALSGFASADFNKTEITPPDATYQAVEVEEAQGGESGQQGPKRTMALIIPKEDGPDEIVTEFTLTAVPDPPKDDAVEMTGWDAFLPDQPYAVYSMHGTLLGATLNDLPEGVYLIRQHNHTFKFVK